VTLLRRRRAAARLALTAETATKGTAFTSNFNYDAATNRLLAQGVYSYDNNGNLTAMPSITNSYDVENRLAQAVHTLNGTEQYVYNPSNQRVWKKEAYETETAYIYGPDGARLATLNASWGGGDHFSNTSLELRLGGRLITSVASSDSTESLVEDRLGSVGASYYFPYGETRSGGPGFQFATYRRDSATQFDYAQQRYYSSKIARFLTPDPFGGSMSAQVPQSFNRYVYTQGDPAGRNDPSGLTCTAVNGIWRDDGNGCPFIGRPVSPYGSFNPNSNGAYETTIWIGNYDLPIYGAFGQGAAIVQAIGQELYNFPSVGVRVQTPLAQTPVGPVQVTTSVVTQYDSGSGASASLAARVSVEAYDLAAAVEHEVSITGEESDTRISGGLDLLGLGAGGVMSPTSGTFGVYVSAGGWGVEAYIGMGGGGGPVDYSSCGWDKDCLSAITEPMKEN
jgi:RHS repeat-associated protein